MKNTKWEFSLFITWEFDGNKVYYIQVNVLEVNMDKIIDGVQMFNNFKVNIIIVMMFFIVIRLIAVDYTLTISVSPEGAGVVSGGGAYSAGVTASLNAIVADGYVFNGWSGDLNASSNPVNLIMDADKSVTAIFVKSSSKAVHIALGSVVEIDVSDVSSFLSEFVKKPMIYGIYSNNGEGVAKFKIVSPTPATKLNALWKKKIRLYDRSEYKRILISDKLSDNPMSSMKFSGVYVTVKNANIYNQQLNNIIYLEPPIITKITGDYTNPGDQFTVIGNYFGSKAPKILVEYLNGGASYKPRYKKCQLVKELSYPFRDAKGRNGKSCMVILEDDVSATHTLGYSEATVIYPNLKERAQPTGYIVVDSGIGLAVYKISDGSGGDTKIHGRQLNINASGSLQNPTFSPDGKYLLCTNFKKGYNKVPSDLLIFNLDDHSIHTLVSDNTGNVNLPGSSWNSMTSKIVFSSDREPHDEIYIISANGISGDEIQLTSRNDKMAFEPTFSPQGDWVVFESHKANRNDNGVINKYKVDGTSDYISLTDSRDNCKQPNWSPTGDLILYQKYANGNWNIWTMDINGNNKTQITSGGCSTDAVFSPNGKWIVYSSDYGGLKYASLFIISVDGGTPIRLTNDNTRYDGAPSWSSDGTKIAFESCAGYPDKSSGTSLFIIDVPVEIIAK